MFQLETEQNVEQLLHRRRSSLGHRFTARGHAAVLLSTSPVRAGRLEASPASLSIEAGHSPSLFSITGADEHPLVSDQIHRP